MFLEFYGFNEQPFGVTPDPRFLYMGPAHDEAFASLIYGIETGRGFMALIAPPGLGKTTLLLRLMEKLRDSALTAFLFQTHTDSREFLKNLLLDLDVAPAGQDLSDLQRQLREVLIRGSHSGKRVVLVIDEAQNLDDSVLEMIRMLSNFETPQAKLLQTILVGQPALADKLARPHLAQLRQRISIIAHFPPLRGDEIEKYIRLRLHVAGYKRRRLFTPAAMVLIAKYSGGIPRIINNLCFNALSLGCAKRQKKIDEAILSEVIADLNLESLGERRGDAWPAAAQPAAGHQGVKGKRVDSLGGFTAAVPGRDIGSQRRATGGSLLDDVEFSNYAPDSTGGIGGGPLYSSGSGADTAGKSYPWATVLALLAIAGVSFFVWRTPWLRPRLDILKRAAWSRLDKVEKQGLLSIGNGRKDALPPQGAPVVKSEESSNPGGKPEESSNLGGKIDLPDSDTRGPRKAVADSPVATLSVAPSAVPLAAETSAPPRTDEKTSPVNPYFRRVKRRSVTSSGRRDYVDDLGARGVRGKLIVQSSVSDARIRIDGRTGPGWVTPHAFSLVAGTYSVSVLRGGYLTWTRSVHVDEGRENSVTADLAYDQGLFILDTDPPGMQVFIDGKPYGASRLETVLRPGWHVCAVFPGQGLRPVMSRFYLKSGEALTRRIRVSFGTASEAPATRPRPSGVGTIGLTPTPQEERLE